MNDVTMNVVGNLVREPVIRYLPDGQPVVNFAIAINPFHRNAQGEWVTNEPLFFEAVSYGFAAEALAVLTKGTEVMVFGVLEDSSFDATTGPRAGQRIRRTQIRAYKVGPTFTANQEVTVVRQAAEEAATA